MRHANLLFTGGWGRGRGAEAEEVEKTDREKHATKNEEESTAEAHHHFQLRRHLAAKKEGRRGRLAVSTLGNEWRVGGWASKG